MIPTERTRRNGLKLKPINFFIVRVVKDWYRSPDGDAMSPFVKILKNLTGEGPVEPVLADVSFSTSLSNQSPL